MISAIPNFPWSLSILVMAVSAMIIFRAPVVALIGRVVEVKAGRVSLRVKAPGPDPEIIKQIEEIAGKQAAADEEHLDAQRLGDSRLCGPGRVSLLQRYDLE